jgi:hypothetical protein
VSNRSYASGANTFGLSEHDSRRHRLDMNQLDSELGEISWGSGLTPKALENAPRSEGGRYRGREQR